MSIPIDNIEDAYSTAEVAKLIRVSKATLLRWLQTAQLGEPRRAIFGGVESRIWTVADLERARAFREERYRRRSKTETRPVGAGTPTRR